MLALGAVHEQVTVTRPEDPPPPDTWKGPCLLPLERNKGVPALREGRTPLRVRPAGRSAPGPPRWPSAPTHRRGASRGLDDSRGRRRTLPRGGCRLLYRRWMPCFVLLETAICSFQTEMAVFLIYVHYVSFPHQWLALARERTPPRHCVTPPTIFTLLFLCQDCKWCKTPDFSPRAENHEPLPPARVPRGGLSREGLWGPTGHSVPTPQTMPSTTPHHPLRRQGAFTEGCGREVMSQTQQQGCWLVLAERDPARRAPRAGGLSGAGHPLVHARGPACAVAL